MINLIQAKKIVLNKLKEFEFDSKFELGILEEETISFEYGWLFFYQSKKYIESNDFKFLIGGNAPIIVDKFNSSLHITGTRMSEEFYIEQYCKFRENIEEFYKVINY